MPGDVIGFACSVELIVQSGPGPFDPEKPVSPRDLASALEGQLGKLAFAIRGDRHRVAEVHVYRVAPTYTSVRKALGLSTPWARSVRRGRKRR